MRGLQRIALILAIALFLLFSSPVKKAVAQVDVGDPAPDFTLTDLDSNSVSLSDYAGLVIFLSFFGYS
ncbi:MAG: redoxin domain-containing protein [bacterium]